MPAYATVVDVQTTGQVLATWDWTVGAYGDTATHGTMMILTWLMLLHSCTAQQTHVCLQNPTRSFLAFCSSLTKALTALPLLNNVCTTLLPTPPVAPA